MKLSPAFFIAFLVGRAYGKPTARAMRIHEARDDIPSSFLEIGLAPPDTVLNLRLALVQGNFPALEQALMDVSTPGSPLYGQHLSKEEVEALVAPKPETIAAVNTWLTENGIEASTVSPAGDWLQFAIPVSKANELLGATFSVFNHTPSGRTVIRTLAYSIPADLKGHVDLVHPTTSFTPPLHVPKLTFIPREEIEERELNVSASCQSAITPACLQALYAIPSAPANVSSNTLGMSGFDEQFANEQDLGIFLETFRPDIPPSTTFNLLTFDGGENPQNRPGILADLDVQYAIGLATNVPTFFASVGPNNTDGADFGLLDLINATLVCSTPPHVIVTTSGEDENALSANLQTNLCNAYAQLGARGISILFASGDGGVAGSQAQNCTTFLPTFPSNCPFVTSVGATTGVEPEVAANFSSGGFSNIFAQPSYQAAAVSRYLSELGNRNAGHFNRSGPSVIALLNDLFAQQGRTPLGFLNPLLYSLQGTDAFTDITNGSNPGCGTNGFPALEGWDAVTGLGTPNFTALSLAIGV
ncbi:family S53 protease [Trametes versicolor FP-101664 SS1]|uniref:family S53 protease n=1 Tax=Trametes versicolor (strain FP-101664) TaxID=717944 RepID=UPI0004621595|nr:family S53 protease [Trametes versicolor FP-101664 SS1]EIW52208.1 family S53 protease [Trametes versicolor FP-101664 SS1]